jgi:hypothetical protein
LRDVVVDEFSHWQQWKMTEDINELEGFEYVEDKLKHVDVD